MCVCVAALVTLAAMSGCVEDKYAISIEPQGDAMVRTLTITRTDNNQPQQPSLPPEVAQSLEQAYAEHSDEGNALTFSGTFTGRTPEDVGGRGFYKNVTTAMGSATLYMERFRGEDDYAAQVARRIETANKVTDLLIAWFQSQPQKDPRLATLGAFLDKQFRKDLQNLSLYMWAGQIAGQYGQGNRPGDAQERAVFPLAQYFAERGYITPEQLPAYTRAAVEANTLQDYRKLMSVIQRMVADRMGVPASEPIPESLNFLADGEETMRSLAETFATTKEYQRRLAAGEEEQQQAAETQPAEVAQSLLSDLVFELIYDRPAAYEGTTDAVDVELHTTTQPVVSNGKWDPATGKVSWSFSAESRDTPQGNIPQLCYAVWAQPAEKFQAEHFGKVVLEGWNLAFYGLWHASLTPAEAKEWDAFVADLRPGASLPEKLAAFHFAAESSADWDTPKGVNRTVAQPITGLIRDALPSATTQPSGE